MLGLGIMRRGTDVLAVLDGGVSGGHEGRSCAHLGALCKDLVEDVRREEARKLVVHLGLQRRVRPP